MARAFGIGVALALAVIAIAAIALSTGIVSIDRQPEVPDRVLVIGIGPDAEGVDLATFAFALTKGKDSVSVLDTTEQVTVGGTSARTPREAFPFVGAKGTAEALKGQTGGSALDWIALPADTWAEFVDQVGGVEFEVGEDTSVYRDGSLVVLESGKHRLTGEQLVSLASSVDYLDAGERDQTLKRLGTAVSSIISMDTSRLPSAVAKGDASSSLTPEQIEMFIAPR